MNNNYLQFFPVIQIFLTAVIYGYLQSLAKIENLPNYLVSVEKCNKNIV